MWCKRSVIERVSSVEACYLLVDVDIAVSTGCIGGLMLPIKDLLRE